MLTLPEYAMQEVDAKLSEIKMDYERCLFFIGSKNCGKTSAIYKFFDINDKPRETLSLDYIYGRKSNHRELSQKLLCHVWEFGGKRESLSRVFNAILRENMTVFLFVDLSKPKYMWDMIEYNFRILENVRSEVEVVVVGAKYDVFKDFDQQTKKTVNTTLRSIALHLNAPLIYFSNIDHGLSKKFKDAMSFYGYKNGHKPKERTTNINKPLIIFNDSWESIGAKLSIDIIRNDLNVIIPQEIELRKVVESFKKDLYPEPEIDTAVRKKLEDVKMSAIGNETLLECLGQK